jgi:hypothetical protein
VSLNLPVGPVAAGWTQPLFESRSPGRTVAGVTLRWPRSLVVWAAVVSSVAAVVMMTEAGKLRDTAWNDTYRYVIAIEKDLGKSEAQAEGVALDFYCDNLARTTGVHGTAATRGAVDAKCVAEGKAQGGLQPNTPRFNLIFDSRPGYPALAAPFVAVFGLNRGLAILSVLLTLLAGWGVLLLIRLAGGGPGAALAGMVACFTLPTWYWLQQFLTESPTLVCVIGVLIGAVLLLRGRTRVGLLASTAAYACGFAVRYSTFSMLAGCMMLTVGLLAWRDRSRRTRSASLLVTYSASVFTVLTLLPLAFGWPGFKDSLEDTFTDHFRKPAPPDLYHRWISLNLDYWPSTFKGYLHAPLVPAVVVLGAVLLWRYRRDLGAIVGAAALTGLGTAAAHPLTSQLDRLYFPVYLLAVCGLPIVVDLLQRRPAVVVLEADGATTIDPTADAAADPQPIGSG